MFFPSTVTRYPAVSKDAHHKITYGEAQELPCRYAKKDKILKDQNGNDVLTIAWIQFPRGTELSKDDKLVLPDGTTSPIVIGPWTIHFPHTGAEMCIEVCLGKEAV